MTKTSQTQFEQSSAINLLPIPLPVDSTSVNGITLQHFK